MNWCGLLFVLTISACGADAATTPAPSQCAQRSGSYVAKYKQRSGTCGETAETVINITTQPTKVDPPCTGSISYTSDNCEVTYDQTCPNDAAIKGGEVSITGHSKWDAAGINGTATEQWVLRKPDKTTACQSTYDVTIARQ